MNGGRSAHGRDWRERPLLVAVATLGGGDRTGGPDRLDAVEPDWLVTGIGRRVAEQRPGAVELAPVGALPARPTVPLLDAAAVLVVIPADRPEPAVVADRLDELRRLPPRVGAVAIGMTRIEAAGLRGRPFVDAIWTVHPALHDGGPSRRARRLRRRRAIRASAVRAPVARARRALIDDVAGWLLTPPHPPIGSPIVGARCLVSTAGRHYAPPTHRLPGAR